jgi:hypothetical protein
MSRGVLPHVAHGNLNRSQDMRGNNDADVAIITAANTWLTGLLDIWIGAWPPGYCCTGRIRAGFSLSI